MEFFRIQRDIPFMRYALIFNVISLITFLVAVVSLSTRGLHLGVDFTGGTVLEVSYKEPPDLNKIRERMVKIGFAEPSALGSRPNRTRRCWANRRSRHPSSTRAARSSPRSPSFCRRVNGRPKTTCSTTCERLPATSRVNSARLCGHRFPHPERRSPTEQPAAVPLGSGRVPSGA